MYIPTVFMVCPAGVVTDITTEAWDGAAAVMAMVGTCPSEEDVPLISTITGASSVAVGSSAEFSAEIVSLKPVTAYSWTFEGATPSTSADATPSVSWTEEGTYEVTLVVSNENGTSEPLTKEVTTFDLSNISDLFVTFEEIDASTSFPKNFFPYGWKAVDVDGGNVYTDLGDYGISGKSTFFVYNYELVSALSFAVPAYEGNQCAAAMTNIGNQGVRNNDWLISPKIQLNDNSSLNLFVRSITAQYGMEEYKIGISTTDDDPASFTIIGGERQAPGNWTKIEIDLAEYDNQEVYVGINYVGNDRFVFMVDNVQIITDPVNITSAKNIAEIYPNPVKDVLNIDNAYGANVEITNMLGQRVLSAKVISNNETINVSNLATGIYCVNVTVNGKTSVHKIVVR